MAEVEGVKYETIELYGHEFEVKLNYDTVTLTSLDVEALHTASRDGYASIGITFRKPNEVED